VLATQTFFAEGSVVVMGEVEDNDLFLLILLKQEFDFGAKHLLS